MKIRLYALFLVVILLKILVVSVVYNKINVKQDVILNLNNTDIEKTSVNWSILEKYDLNRMIYVSNGSKICDKGNDSLLLIAVIISSPDNTQRRRDLRDSWIKPLSTSNLTKVIFFMGQNETESVNENLISENEKYMDLVVVDFEDTYRNLSLKTILMLRWVRDFCPQTRFILKSDDDMFINVFNLMKFIREDNPKPKSIYGDLAHNWSVSRDNDSKWMVTKEEYSDTYYPDFVTGPSYLIEMGAVSELIESCVRLPYLFLEDVFVTGLCAQSVNVSRFGNVDFVNGPLPRRKCEFYSVISVHRIFGRNLQVLHQKVTEFREYSKCWKRVPKMF